MQTLDWAIVGTFVAFLLVVTLITKRHNKSVADFLVANRSAGRYLLTISGAATWLVGANLIAAMQRDYVAGFCGVWWLITLTQPLLLLFALSGWVTYRYRETRAMTMGQMQEMRYSRSFRIFCSVLAWVGGVINMGVQPAVTAKFFIYYFALPATFPLMGFEVSTFPFIIICELLAAMLIIMLGGMIVVAITDFFQGIFCIVALLAVLFAISRVFDWDQIFATLANSPAGESRLNPFESTKTPNFGMSYFIILTWGMVYGSFVFLGAQGYQGAARSAHESKMARVLSGWRYTIQTGLIILLPISVFVFMNHADFATGAADVSEVLGGIANEKVVTQVRAPMAMLRFLPAGVIGLFGAFFLAATISTDDTFLHSWGSILVQDIILPLRKKPLSPKAHMWMLRGSMAIVAVLVFFISFLWQHTENLYMWFALSAAIYGAGAGICVIGALYWKRGTTKAAWVGMITGSTLSLSAVMISTLWANSLGPWVAENWPNLNWLSKSNGDFCLNGQWMGFIAGISAISAYVAVSLYDWKVLNKPAFNLDRFLHRGKYSIAGEHGGEITRPPTGLRAFLPSKEFSLWDKFLYLGAVVWSVSALMLGGITAIVYVINGGISIEYWMNFWKYLVYVFAVLGVITTVWFLIGGLRDIKHLFAKLGSMERDDADDGRVIENAGGNEDA